MSFEFELSFKFEFECHSNFNVIEIECFNSTWQKKAEDSSLKLIVHAVAFLSTENYKFRG